MGTLPAGNPFVPCGKFPYLVFYQERTDVIAIIRVLHGSRDIPPTLRALAGSD